jgi:GNAT superfamily N-acetyltransferase
MENILRRDGFGAPFDCFSSALFRTAVRDFLGTARDVYFIVAEWRGDYAGFALGHTLGPWMWRHFAKSYFIRHPLGMAWLVLRLKVIRPIRESVGAKRTSSIETPNLSSASDSIVRPLNRPFAWTYDHSNRGQVDQLFVREAYRGKGIASEILKHLVGEMAPGGVRLIEAHVDSTNLASLHAFQRAGWDAFRASEGDFLVRWLPMC